MAGLEGVFVNGNEPQGFQYELTMSSPQYALSISQFVLGHCYSIARRGHIEVTLDKGENHAEHHEYSFTKDGALRFHLPHSAGDALADLRSLAPALQSGAAQRHEQEIREIVAIVLKALANE